jgi:hypothetical protein
MKTLTLFASLLAASASPLAQAASLYCETRPLDDGAPSLLASASASLDSTRDGGLEILLPNGLIAAANYSANRRGRVHMSFYNYETHVVFSTLESRLEKHDLSVLTDNPHGIHFSCTIR